VTKIVTTAVIAAAGLGSRLGLGYPKCLVNCYGTKILEHQLSLLNFLEDIRVVVGYRAELVSKLARSIRSDIKIILNADFKTTSTLDSYRLGAAGCDGNVLFLDGDIIFEKPSFISFIDDCQPNENMLAITHAKTADAVYCDVDSNTCINSFSRSIKTNYEWANLAWISPKLLSGSYPSVFESLTSSLPLRAKVIRSYEIDRKSDYDCFVRAFPDIDDCKKILLGL